MMRRARQFNNIIRNHRNFSHKVADNVKVIESLSDFDDFQKKSRLDKSIIYYTAAWCTPCKAISPIFSSMSLKYPKINFLKVDVDVASDVATSHDIRAMPTFHMYANGERQNLLEFTGSDSHLLEHNLELLSKV